MQTSQKIDKMNKAIFCNQIQSLSKKLLLPMANICNYFFIIYNIQGVSKGCSVIAFVLVLKRCDGGVLSQIRFVAFLLDLVICFHHFQSQLKQSITFNGSNIDGFVSACYREFLIGGVQAA